MSTATATVDTHHAIHDEEHPPPVVWSSKTSINILGMFFFIGSETALFGAFFMAYFFIRVAHSTDYSTWAHLLGQTIPIKVATMNSLVLFSSSVTVHWAGIAMRRGARAWQSIWVAATLVLGLSFFSVQVLEYSRLLGNDKIGPSTNAYSSVFFSITGLHGSHVVIGAVLLAVMLVRSIRGHYGPEPERHQGWEAMSIYWHFVDLVWVFVFGLIYLPGNIDRWHQWPIMAIGVPVLFVLWHLPRFIGKGAPAH